MHLKSWEYLALAGFLVICLLAGLALGQWWAPEPIIGQVRFDAMIDFNSAEKLIDVLEAARQDDRIAAVVMELASPGGLATSSESIFYTMLKLRAEKPLVVVIDGIAVSGGYYMAAAANRIYAPASSYVANVGTRGPKPNDPTLPPEEMSSGPYKLSGGSRFDHVRQLDLVRDAFVKNVVNQRRNAEANPLQMDPETVAEARIYLGSEAVALGLIDYEGGRSDALAGAAELAGLDRYTVVNLIEHLRLDPTQTRVDYQAGAKTMVETAPPDAVFLLDSRIPLPGLRQSSEVEQHMLKLRAIAPASLDEMPETTGSSVSENVTTPASSGEGT